MELSADERRLRAQIAANESWGQCEDRSARTEPARTALLAKFLEQAGGDPVRAENLRKAHYQRLALKSAVARRKNREARERMEAADVELQEALDALGETP
jgi:hypothetical protein